MLFSLLFEIGGSYINIHTDIYIYTHTHRRMNIYIYVYMCVYIQRKIDKDVIFLCSWQGISPEVRRSGGRIEVGRKGNEEGIPLSASANDKKKIANQTL